MRRALTFVFKNIHSLSHDTRLLDISFDTSHRVAVVGSRSNASLVCDESKRPLFDFHQFDWIVICDYESLALFFILFGSEIVSEYLGSIYTTSFCLDMGRYDLSCLEYSITVLDF